MNCMFKILWFEDNNLWLKSKMPAISGMITKHHLEENIISSDGTNLNIDEITGNAFDLILMDYKLYDTTTGDTIIKAIREARILTDILFYSSQYDDMLRAVQALTPPMDGVYYADRKSQEFEDKTEKLIDKIVHRSEDVVNLRGFVLDNSSDFETRIVNVINVIWQKLNQSEKDELNTKLRDYIEKQMRHWQSKATTACGKDCTFTECISGEFRLSNNDWLYIMNNIIEIIKNGHGFSPNGFVLNFSDEYGKKIAQYRNKLGHITIQDTSIVVAGKTIPIDDKLHQTMRQNIHCVEKLIAIIEKFAFEQL